MRAAPLLAAGILLCTPALARAHADKTGGTPARDNQTNDGSRHAVSRSRRTASRVPYYERYSCTYVPRSSRQRCIAATLARYPRVAYVTWYGDSFRGKETTSGDVFNPDKFTAASRELPFGTIVRVTNLLNGRRAIVRINDRGPWHTKCVLDLSLGTARQLRFVSRGYVKAYIEVLSPPAPQTRIAQLTAKSTQ